MNTNISPFGIKQGSFRVDANGEALYQLPLEIPPGINGMQPTLALSYNHRQGNGICGVGWSLSGVPAISRINANNAIDGFRGGINYDTDDRFALDGQRLINMTGDYGNRGTVYYTEHHNWDKVIAGDTLEDGFVVYKKNGEIWSFGATSDSRIFANTPARDINHIRVWALSSVEDRNGNRIEYSYTNTPNGGVDKGAYYLSQIRYTKNRNTAPCFSVNFIYNERPDQLVKYIGGALVGTDFLLTGITTNLGLQTAAGTILSYTLNYRQSQATKLSQLYSVVVSDAAGNALPPVNIDWQDVDKPSFNAQAASQFLNEANIVQTIPMDVNGDGISDIVQLYAQGQTIGAVSYMPVNQNDTIIYNKINDQQLGYYSNYQAFAADVNGDGLQDLLIIYPGGQGNANICIDVFISNGTSFNTPLTAITTSYPWLGTVPQPLGFYPMDVDGDGRIDLVYAWPDSSNNNIVNFQVFLSQFTGNSGSFTQSTNINTGLVLGAVNKIWPVDVNGDGMVDMVVLWKNSADNSLNVTSFFTKGGPGTTDFLIAGPAYSSLDTTAYDMVSIYPADVNGDGMMDILYVYKNPANYTINIQPFFSDATGKFVAGPLSSFANFNGDTPIQPMAINGTGQTNLVLNWVDNSQYWNYMILSASSSGGFTQGAGVTTTQQLPAISNKNLLVGDANGNGKADLFYFYVDSNNNCNAQLFLSDGAYPGLVSSITNMLGGKIDIAYAPLTDPHVYTHSNASVYPAMGPLISPSLQAPAQLPRQEVMGKAIYVVSGYTLSNDTGINRFPYSYAYRMQYSNARIDLNGHGWLGFQNVLTTNLGTGLRTIQTYLQDYPFTGSLASELKEADGTISTDPRVQGNAHVLMSLTVNTLSKVSHAGQGASSSTAYEIQKTGSFSYNYDYGLTNYDPAAKKYTNFSQGLDYLIATSAGYDDYGNEAAKTWWGYVDFTDPLTIDHTAPFPVVLPINIAEVVHTFRLFQNKTSGKDWALGYLLYEKETSDKNNNNIKLFQPGDFNLSAYSYVPQTYNLQNHASWDNQNNCWLEKNFAYDGFGNKTSETWPGGAMMNYSFETAYNTYIDTITYPANTKGMRAITRHGYDPRFGVQVAEQSENGAIHIAGLDGFGRKIKKQGPVPAGCSQTDINVCSTLVTGTTNMAAAPLLALEAEVYVSDDGRGNILVAGEAHLAAAPALMLETEPFAGDTVAGSSLATGTAHFTTAQVLTLETISYLHDGAGGIYASHNTLQQFPSGPDRVFMTRMQYVDALAREAMTATEAGSENGYVVSLKTYDSNGKTLSQSLPVFSKDLVHPGAPPAIVRTYDVLNRLIQYTNPAGDHNQYKVINTLTHAAGQKTVITKAPGTVDEDVQVVTSHYYNSKKHHTRSEVKNDGNATTIFLYDALGRIMAITDPQQKTNTISYDSLNRKLVYDNPDQNAVGDGNKKALLYKYLPATGHIDTITEATGTVISYQYDDLGRVTRQIFSDGREYAIEYDTAVNGIGKPAAITIYASGRVEESGKAFSYDVYGNKTSEKLMIDGFSYNTVWGFDPVNRIVSQTFDDGAVLQQVYDYGQLVGQQMDEIIVDYPIAQYTPTGNFGKIFYVHNHDLALDVSFGFNDTGDRYTETLQSNGQTVLNFKFDYDDLNQLTESFESIEHANEQYQYINSRLAFISNPVKNINGKYAYDNSGRIISKDGNQYTYQASNCPASISGNNISYSAERDESGRVVIRTLNGRRYDISYNSSGNVKSIRSGATMLRTMLYDESNRLIRETRRDGTVTTFVHPHCMIVEEASGKITVRKLVADKLGIVASVETTSNHNKVAFYRRNHKGSITHVFDASGNMQYELAYDGMGLPLLVKAPAGGTLDDIWPQYEGRHFDTETGLYCFGSRYYDPYTGTFLSPDTRMGGQNKLIPGVWNRFAFELNNPVNHIDPSGHISLWAKVGICVGLAVLTAAAIVLSGGTAAAVAPEAAGVEMAVAGVGEASAAGAAEASAAGVAEAGAAEAGEAGAAEAGEAAGSSVGRSAARAGINAAARKAAAEAGKRIAINAARGAICGAVSGGGISGIVYFGEGGDSWSGFGKAVAKGAISGAFTGGVAEGVGGYVGSAVTGGAGGIIFGAAANVGATFIADAAVDQQLPSAQEITIAAVTGGAAAGAKGIWKGGKYDQRLSEFKNSVLRDHGSTIMRTAYVAVPFAIGVYFDIGAMKGEI